MTSFEQFIINKYPLYAKVDFESINVSWGEVFKLHDEWLKDNQPILTVEVHEPKPVDFADINCGHRFQIDIGGHQRCIYCGVIKILSFDETVKQTQDNHLKTNG